LRVHCEVEIKQLAMFYKFKRKTNKSALNIQVGTIYTGII